MKGSFAFIAAAVLAVIAMMLAGMYGALVLWVRLWEYHPQIAELASVGFLVAIMLAGVGLRHFTRRRPPDDSDEGGEPRKPYGPRPRGPSGPEQSPPDWESFERLRRDWERVPSPH